jgi:predicted CopG family antitoxin
MMTKAIKISVSTHNALSELASKKDTFNDVINRLIDYYIENEEFSDEEAEFYNKEIENFERGNLNNVSEITLEELDERITLLEQEIKHDL